ncbi:hypothetical protein HDU98_010818 [Podochytrium sp. JEL0797]|nr:hypothetical protein HDU98_010818 [Podochytrium sp. JEL0797]
MSAEIEETSSTETVGSLTTTSMEDSPPHPQSPNIVPPLASTGAASGPGGQSSFVLKILNESKGPTGIRLTNTKIPVTSTDRLSLLEKVLPPRSDTPKPSNTQPSLFDLLTTQSKQTPPTTHKFPTPPSDVTPKFNDKVLLRALDKMNADGGRERYASVGSSVGSNGVKNGGEVEGLSNVLMKLVDEGDLGFESQPESMFSSVYEDLGDTESSCGWQNVREKENGEKGRAVLRKLSTLWWLAGVGAGGEVARGGVTGFPLDLLETEKEFHLFVDVSGAQEGDVALEVVEWGNVVCLKVEIEDSVEVMKKGQRVTEKIRERRVGKMVRRVELDGRADASDCDAVMFNGLLHVRVGKMKQTGES